MIDWLLRMICALVLRKVAADERLARFCQIIKPVLPSAEAKNFVSVMNNLAQQHFPGFAIIRNFLNQEMRLDYRRVLVYNFFANVILKGHGQRTRIKQELGINVPLFFVISPTMRCNLNCIGCYAGEYNKKQELDFATVDRLIEEAKKLGIYFITFSGGEPFLWENKQGLLKIFEKHRDVMFQIYTNGTLLDEKVVNKLVKLGNAAPAISLEGGEAITDLRRGHGVYAEVTNAMERLQKARAVFGFSVTATRYNIEEIGNEEFLDKMISRGCSFGWYFLYIPIGKEPDYNLMPTPEQRDWLRQQIRRFRREKKILIVDFWNDGGLAGGCIAGGRRYFHITNTGDVTPCVFAPFAIDNIYCKTLLEILDSQFFRDIQNHQPYSKNLLRPCMIIDHPWFLRDFLEQHKAYSVDGGEAPKVDEYALQYAKLADRAWQDYGKEDIWTGDLWGW